MCYQEANQSSQLKEDVNKISDDSKENPTRIEDVNHIETECFPTAWKVRDNDQITTSELKNVNSVEIVEKTSSFTNDEYEVGITDIDTQEYMVLNSSIGKLIIGKKRGRPRKKSKC